MSDKKSLVAKLVDIMAEIDHVEKRGRNEFHRYNYVKATDLANAVRKRLADKNVLMISSVTNRVDREVPTKDGTQQQTDLMIEYTFHDGDSGEKIFFSIPGSGADKGDKGVYKAITGSLKYALRNQFLVPDESDPEGDEEQDARTHGGSRGKARAKAAADGAGADVPERGGKVATFEGIITDLQASEDGEYSAAKVSDTVIIVIEEDLQADFRKHFHAKTDVRVPCLEKISPSSNKTYWEARSISVNKTLTQMVTGIKESAEIIKNGHEGLVKFCQANQVSESDALRIAKETGVGDFPNFQGIPKAKLPHVLKAIEGMVVTG